MSFDSILRSVGEYYGEKVRAHGATPRGVDWNSAESQMTRFDQLLRMCDVAKPFSINDYGCGYGALVDYMAERGLTFRYHGFDISPLMIAKADETHSGTGGCVFSSDGASIPMADYTVACGIFGVRLEHGDAEWKEYVLHTLGRLDALSRKGFAFNMLTKYSDADKMRPDLYYGDPCFFFDYCKTRFSKWVALLHDYGLYEFTITVRKPEASAGASEPEGAAP